MPPVANMPSIPRTLLTLGLAATILAACAPVVPREELVARSQALAEQALASARQGDYAAAAERYREAAAIADEGPARLYRLEAAGMLLDAGRTQEAEKLLASLPEMPADEQARRHRQVARAIIAHRQGRTDDAVALVADVEVGEAGPLQRRWLELRAALAAARGDPLAEARARSALEDYRSGAGAAANRAALWAALKAVPVADLEALADTAPPRLAGWAELAAAAGRYETNGGALMTALAAWSERHPDHPARAEYLPRLEETALTLGTRPDHIAVILPTEGPFAKAGTAVRDGIVAAWLTDAVPDRPRLAFYPEDAGTLWETYAAAMEAGAQLVIGPLSKEALAVLGAGERMPLPTLALNQLEARTAGGEPVPPPVQLFQFGLSPEAEAREAALRAWFDGHRQALVLRPDSDWGGRVGEAFVREWQARGGMVAEADAYGATPNEMSEAVAALVNVDASAERGRALRAALARRLETEPRPRRDAGLVFLAASPEDARQLRPQLRFHRAGDLAVYSTSRVNPGRVEETAARDLAGIRFGDMPWMLRDDPAHGAIRRSLERHWPNRMAAYPRLYALGVDAYDLAAALPRLAARPATRVEGATGRMGLDPQGRVHRELTWAEFTDSGVRLLDIPYDAP